VSDQVSRFLKYNFPLLAFGFWYTFFSSYGQTFLLSLYLPSIEDFFKISNTALGSIYAIATVGSALTLPWLGGYFDKAEVKRYSVFVVVGLIGALLLMSFAYHILFVVLAFYGLRLFGQGLMSHTSVSAMARYFTANRGKAISVATIGHPAGEAALPILITLLIGAVGWRSTLQLSALSCLVLVIPLAIILLKKSKARIRAYEMESHTDRKNFQRLSIWKVFGERRFWIIAPVVFILGFTNTAIFFFQLKLGEAKGWSPEWVAGSLSAFAVASAVGMLTSGPLVDRLTGKKLFPWFLIPYLAGLVVLISYDHRWVYPAALALMGLANGMGSTIKNAMLAEIYGAEVIGQIRSIFTTVMVVSTALGPITFGVLLDLDWSFGLIFGLGAVAMALTTLNGVRRIL
jgi:MFS family permease